MLPYRLARLFLFLCLISVWPLQAGSLVDAARENDQQRVARMLDAGADINEAGPQGATPLHWMAFHGNEAMVARLIEAGANVNATLDNGSSALHLAAYKGHTETVRLLLKSQANTNARTHDGITPLDWARRNGHRATEALLGGTQNPVAKMSDDAPRTADPDRARSTAAGRDRAPAGARYRIQLVALSSEQRAKEAAAEYGERYARILEQVTLGVAPANGAGRPVYRVQSDAVSSAQATAICDQMRRHGQSCVVLTSGGDRRTP